jgi:hypothetical protein
MAKNTSFAVYSLPDVVTVINNPSVGKCVLSKVGGGRITVSYANDMASVTTTATGYVVINKLVAKNGAISMEIPTNSEADSFLRKLIAYVEKAKTSEFALTTLSLQDPAAKRTLNFTGVVPQKKPDEGYDQTSGNRQYTFLFAEMTTA